MGGDAFGSASLGDGVAELAGHGIVVEVMACELVGAGVRTKSGGGEEPLPAPLTGDIRPFAQEGLGHMGMGGTDF